MSARRCANRCRCCATSRGALPLIWPVHPRARGNIERFGLARAARRMRAIALLPPQGYLEMLGLLAERDARADRLRRHPGGDDGARRAVPHDAREHRTSDHRRAGHEHARRPQPRSARSTASTRSCARGGKRGRMPELWDGRAAERIADDLRRAGSARDRRAPSRHGHRRVT